MLRPVPETTIATAATARRRPWSLPTLRELPKLTDLTLASAIGGGGGTGGGGSTVFGILFALFALTGCFSDPGAPSAEAHPVPQLISCRATVATGTIDCGGPQAAPEILGGQGTFVALRSTNVAYDGSAIFQADVNVQNLASQTIGALGNGVDVFFQSGPTVTGGTGTVTVNNPSGNATFTASGQDYFHYGDSVQTGAYSSTLTWKWNVPATVTSFVFTVQVSAEVADAGGVLLWSLVPQFASDSFIDIAVNSSTDAMAVGKLGLVYRKVGAEWHQLSNQTAVDWVAIEAIGGDQYLGATTSSVYLFDGKVWKQLYTPGFPILSLSGRAADRIIVGGFEQLRWLGTGGWQSAGITGRNYQFVAALGGDQAIALATTSGQVRINFNSASISSTSDGFEHTALYAGLVGNFGFGVKVGGPSAYIRDDASSFLYGPAADTIIDAVDFGATATERWAVARSNTSGVSVLMHLNAGTWTTVTSLPDTIQRMTQDSAGGVYLLFADGLRRWNGSALNDELVAPASDTPVSLSALTTATFVGMNSGDIFRYTGGSWSSAGTFDGAPITLLAAFGPNAAWAIDSGAHLHEFNGTSWAYTTALSKPLNGLWALSPTEAVVVGGLNTLGGIIQRQDGSGWAASFTPGLPDYNAVWGTSIDDFWAVGNDGRVTRYLDPNYTEVGGFTADSLFAVTGTSSNDVWVAGTNGYIAHWDGASWTPCALGGATIRTLYSPGPGVVYAGTGAVSDTLTAASCGARAVHIPGAYDPVTAMSGTSAGNLWAIVGTRVYWGHR
jgi:hypothetical protein